MGFYKANENTEFYKIDISKKKNKKKQTSSNIAEEGKQLSKYPFCWIKHFRWPSSI